MSKRRDIDGDVSVTGPGCERDGLPTVDVGVSLAITVSERLDQPGTWYVRDGGTTRVVVERHDDRSTTISPYVPRKGAVAEVVSL